MTKRLIASLACIAFVTACNPARKDEAAQPAGAATADASQPTGQPTGQPSGGLPADVSGAEALVKQLNAREAVPGTAAENAQFFAADLAAALTADGSQGEVGEVNYDYRWNAQDFETSEVTYAALPVGEDGALITVSFKNFGEPRQTFYDLCERPDASWRIRDVRSNDKPDGSLRQMLKLGPSSQATSC